MIDDWAEPRFTGWLGSRTSNKMNSALGRLIAAANLSPGALLLSSPCRVAVAGLPLGRLMPLHSTAAPTGPGACTIGLVQPRDNLKTKPYLAVHQAECTRFRSPKLRCFPHKQADRPRTSPYLAGVRLSKTTLPSRQALKTTHHDRPRNQIGALCVLYSYIVGVK